MIPFDREFASKSAEEFVERCSSARSSADAASRWARTSASARAPRGDADVPALARPSSRRAWSRSSRSRARPSPRRHIRGLVAAGEVDDAARFLGAPFLFEGEVVARRPRGRELGMPTANIVPDDALVSPGHGVYAAWAHGASRRRSTWACARPSTPAAACWSRPTCSTSTATSTAQTLRIAFLERLRGEQRFESVDELVAQMRRDVERTREICA